MSWPGEVRAILALFLLALLVLYGRNPQASTSSMFLIIILCTLGIASSSLFLERVRKTNAKCTWNNKVPKTLEDEDGETVEATEAIDPVLSFSNCKEQKPVNSEKEFTILVIGVFSLMIIITFVKLFKGHTKYKGSKYLRGIGGPMNSK